MMKKFKAFDTFKGEWIDEKLYLIGAGGIAVTMHQDPRTGAEQLIDNPNLEIVMWSGYIDQDMNEIYEGDIIEIVGPRLDYPSLLPQGSRLKVKLANGAFLTSEGYLADIDIRYIVRVVGDKFHESENEVVS